MNETTRFNPTANGPLHIGHAYSALINEALAAGGKFIVRVDDNCRLWWQRRGGPRGAAEFAQGQLDDLAWLGVFPDRVVYQSAEESRVLAFLAASRWQQVVDHFPNPYWDPEILSVQVIQPIALASYITAEKVVLDHFEGVTAMVRGLELLSEHQLYLYLCALFGFAPPHCVYATRLMTWDGEELGEVSKTKGNLKIQDLRDRKIPSRVVLEVLREACLVDPTEGFTLDNLKAQPRLPEKCF